MGSIESAYLYATTTEVSMYKVRPGSYHLCWYARSDLLVPYPDVRLEVSGVPVDALEGGEYNYVHGLSVYFKFRTMAGSTEAAFSDHERVFWSRDPDCDQMRESKRSLRTNSQTPDIARLFRTSPTTSESTTIALKLPPGLPSHILCYDDGTGTFRSNSNIKLTVSTVRVKSASFKTTSAETYSFLLVRAGSFGAFTGQEQAFWTKELTPDCTVYDHSTPLTAESTVRGGSAVRMRPSTGYRLPAGDYILCYADENSNFRVLPHVVLNVESPPQADRPFVKKTVADGSNGNDSYQKRTSAASNLALRVGGPSLDANQSFVGRAGVATKFQFTSSSTFSGNELVFWAPEGVRECSSSDVKGDGALNGVLGTDGTVTMTLGGVQAGAYILCYSDDGTDIYTQYSSIVLQVAGPDLVQDTTFTAPTGGVVRNPRTLQNLSSNDVLSFTMWQPRSRRSVRCSCNYSHSFLRFVGTDQRVDNGSRKRIYWKRTSFLLLGGLRCSPC